jgi:hypothetical protein
MQLLLEDKRGDIETVLCQSITTKKTSDSGRTVIEMFNGDKTLGTIELNETKVTILPEPASA